MYTTGTGTCCGFTLHAWSLASTFREPETILKFSEECVNNVVEAYCPIVKKHMNDEYTPEQKAWQQVRGVDQREGWPEAGDLQDGESMGRQ